MKATFIFRILAHSIAFVSLGLSLLRLPARAIAMSRNTRPALVSVEGVPGREPRLNGEFAADLEGSATVDLNETRYKRASPHSQKCSSELRTNVRPSRNAAQGNLIPIRRAQQQARPARASRFSPEDRHGSAVEGRQSRTSTIVGGQKNPLAAQLQQINLPVVMNDDVPAAALQKPKYYIRVVDLLRRTGLDTVILEITSCVSRVLSVSFTKAYYNLKPVNVFDVRQVASEHIETRDVVGKTPHAVNGLGAVGDSIKQMNRNRARQLVAQFAGYELSSLRTDRKLFSIFPQVLQLTKVLQESDGGALGIPLGQSCCSRSVYFAIDFSKKVADVLEGRIPNNFVFVELHNVS